jgi:hypothetical protein
MSRQDHRNLGNWVEKWGQRNSEPKNGTLGKLASANAALKKVRQIHLIDPLLPALNINLIHLFSFLLNNPSSDTPMLHGHDEMAQYHAARWSLCSILLQRNRQPHMSDRNCLQCRRMAATRPDWPEYPQAKYR